MNTRPIGLILVLGAILTGCGAPPPAALPGYAEAEYVHVAAPYAGRLIALPVAKGAQVRVGTPLFALDQDSERAAVLEYQARVVQSEAQAADLDKGKRQDEIAALAAQADAAQANLRLAARDLARQQQLARAGFTSGANLDALRERVASAQAQLDEAQAQLRVAHLAARDDTRSAARAAVKTAQAQLDQTRWKLEQKTLSAPVAAQVEDTLFRVGEWVPAGSPVVNLLAPNAIKVRFFVPQDALARLKPGATVSVRCDGCGAPFAARIGFIASNAEYTPPVIYSKENRAKLVFMVEAWPAPGSPLRPGQPVDVQLAPAS